MLKAIFIVFIELPRHVSASKCHLQWFTLPCKLLQFLVCVSGGCGLLSARCGHLLASYCSFEVCVSVVCGLLSARCGHLLASYCSFEVCVSVVCGLLSARCGHLLA